MKQQIMDLTSKIYRFDHTKFCALQFFIELWQEHWVKHCLSCLADPKFLAPNYFNTRVNKSSYYKFIVSHKIWTFAYYIKLLLWSVHQEKPDIFHPSPPNQLVQRERYTFLYNPVLWALLDPEILCTALIRWLSGPPGRIILKELTPWRLSCLFVTFKLRG